MVDPPTSPTVTPPPPSLPNSNLPMIYYGLVVVATAAIVLVLYNLIVLKWCAELPNHSPPHGSSRRRQRAPPAWRINSYIFKYKGDGGDSECAVCLSVFEEGEEITQLPKCNHNFHTPCIDMWLYSHMDCPLCRSPVEPPGLHHREEPEHSQEELLGAATLV